MASFAASPSISSGRGLGRGGNPSLKKTIQLYKAQLHRLESKLEQLLHKREELDSRAFVVLDEDTSIQQDVSSIPLTHQTVQVPEGENVPSIQVLAASQSTEGIARREESIQLTESETEKSKQLLSPTHPIKVLVEQTETYHSDVTSLVSTATNTLIESLELRLTFIREALQKLNMLYRENPKLPTPPELAFLRYEEWLASNQRLFELNGQLYDLERLKFELKQKQLLARKVIKRSKKGEDVGLAGSMFLKSSVQRIQSFMSRFAFEPPVQDTTQSYLQELLNPRGDRTTLEAQKIQEFVRVCMANTDTPTDTVIGAHPQSYQQFMTILCNYIVEKQREVQGEQLPYALVYSTVERHMTPKILPAIMRHVSVRERDQIIAKQCDRFSGITLEQLKVKEKLRSTELVPFLDAITQLRASYFSSTPTDKMYAVVAAAKALYERLGSMGESSIDGDTFLDLWVYVILKANVKDLATNLQFMAEYGNPMLAMDEAGYYLTSLEAAVTFIETLEPEQLDLTNVPTDFIICECSKFECLSKLPSACFQTVSHRDELPGYRVGVIRQWALNRARLFSAVLVYTGDPNDTAVVSVIRFSLDCSCAQHTQYFTKALRHPEKSLEGLSSIRTPLGLAVVADTANMNPHNLLLLPTGDFDSHEPRLHHVLQLIRLGSETCEDISNLTVSSISHTDTVDAGYIYVHTPHQRDLLHPLIVGKQRPRLKSEDGQSPHHRAKSRAVNTRRATSFNESIPGYSVSPSSSPYLLSFDSNLEVSLDTLPASSLTKPRNKQSWFGRNFRNKEKNEVSSGPNNHTSKYPGSSSEYTRKYPSSGDGYTSIPSADHSPAHQESSNVQTVEIEVYDHSSSVSSSQQLDSVITNSQPDSRGGYHNKLFSLDSSKFIVSSKSTDSRATITDSQGRTTSLAKSAQSSDLNTRSLSFQSSSDSIPPRSKLSTGESRDELVLSGVSQLSSLLADNPFLVTSQRFLSDEFVRLLEENFLKNHVIAEGSDPVGKTMETVIRLGQLYLQRLNYLSGSFKIDGVYSDITLNAVLRFQVSHNTNESLLTVPLPENGQLTAATFQYLRQAFITIYASMIRLGLDKYLGVHFDPISTDNKDVQLFRECVCKFQEESDLIGRCQMGVLCTDTIDKLRQIIRSQQYTM